MSKVTPAPAAVHDLLAGAFVPDQPFTGPGVTLLVVLVAVALVLFSAMRALVAAVALLLAPLFLLARSFVLVVGLIVVLGLGLANGDGDPRSDQPGGTRPSPTAESARPRPARPATPPAPARPKPSAKSSLAAPDR